MADGQARVAYVTASDPRVLVDDTDRPILLAALAGQGAVAEGVAWDDPAVEWAAFDVILVRSPWDYPERVAEVLAWLDRVGGLPALHNPAAAIRWNLDKRYLGELADAGVPVVPSAFATTVAEAATALEGAALGGQVAERVVVKPTVSAGSRDTGLFDRGDAAALALAERIVGEGRTAMVQPAVPSVADHGEVAFVLVDGEVSHAYTKGPLLAVGGGLRSDGEYREERELVTSPSPGWRETAVRVHDVVCERLVAAGSMAAGPLLYARIDLVALPSGEPALLEAELFEPFLSLDLDVEAAGRLATAGLARREHRLDR